MNEQRRAQYKLELTKCNTYTFDKVDKLFKELLHSVLLEKPDDLVEFMILHLIEVQNKERAAAGLPPKRVSEPDHLAEDSDVEKSNDSDVEKSKDSDVEKSNDSDVEKSNDSDPQRIRGNDDEMDAASDAARFNRARMVSSNRCRRAAVSAEPVDISEMANYKCPVIDKTEEQKSDIRKAIAHNILFSSLDDEQSATVLGAMFEKKYSSGEYIIRQGEEGDNFYVLSNGTCECYVNQADKDPLMVKVYEPGESFGELALMYNCARAASIVAKTDVQCWAMDRMTFRSVLMDTTNRKRKRYEDFLAKVPLLECLDRYERAKVADALNEVSYSDGDYVIKLGESGNIFYLVESGEAVVTKPLSGVEAVEVLRLKSGDYFGELALLNDSPRAANVIAHGDLKCAMLDRAAFVRLLGPCDQIMGRNQQLYQTYEKQLHQNKERKTTPSIRELQDPQE